MQFLQDIFVWFRNCILAVPESVVTGIITSLLILLISRVLHICGDYFSGSGNFFRKLQSLLAKQPEISLNYQIIPSPKYQFEEKKSKKTSSLSDNEIWAIIIGVLVAMVIGIIGLRLYKDIIQFVIYAISVFFICSGILFILISAVTNRIQKSTLLYCIFGSILSFYTYYSAEILPTLISKIPPDFNIKYLFSKIEEGWAQVYMFTGLLITVFEILLILLLFCRMCFIKVDSYKSFRTIRYAIYKTEFLDSIGFLIFILILLTTMSYLLTSGMFIDFVYKHQRV